MAERPVKVALDVERRVDAIVRLQRNWRDRGSILAFFARFGLVVVSASTRIFAVNALSIAPAPAKQYRDPLLTAGKQVVAATGIGSQNAGEVFEMALAMLLPPIARGTIERRRW